MWVETQRNKIDRRDSMACLNLQLSGYASDLNGKNVETQCVWMETQCNLKVDRNKRSKRFYCMHQSTAVRICFRLKWKKCDVWVET